MKRFHYMLMLLALLVCQNAKAQFNPEPPDEPGARPWQLTLKAVPAEAGYFNLNQQSRHVADEKIQITAYTNSGYRFVCWEDSLGNTLTTKSSWSYTMPKKNVTLTARYEYSPATPDEPGQASIKKRLFLKTNPADAGRFNLGGTNNVAVGQAVHLQVYGNQNYIFRNWTEDGAIISSAAAFTYTMPDKDVTLTANFDFDYQPGTPGEPGQPQLQTCVVYAMREDAVAGQTCSFPVYFENNGSDVTGFAVDVSFPQGFTVNSNDATLTGSVAGRRLNVSLLDANTWHFEISGSSSIERGDSKALLIPVSIPSTATAGSVYTVELKNGIMVKSDGQQASVKVRSGSLKIVHQEEEHTDSPDYVVSDLQTTSSNVAPGDEIQVTWKVENQGKRVGPARWTERIYLVSSTGRKVSIGTTSYDSGQLQPGEAISRSATLLLGKMPGIDGKLNIVVTIVPSTSAGETADNQQNNTTETTGSPINLSKLLYLTLPDTPQVEGSVKTIRCQLARSGDWRNNETFTVKTIKGDSRISVPEAIFIPRDQSATYFYLPMANNDTYDTNTIVSFNVEGNGYPAVTGQIVIEDDEQPALSLSASKSVVSEGETFQLTVTASRAPAEDLTVTLTSENNKRFTFPRKVIIPAGKTSVTVDVTAKDDDIPSETLSNVFTASAARYNQGEYILILEDNDMPVLQLTLTPNKVTEGAGPVSVAGVLRRTGVTNNKITVRLSDDSNGNLYFPTRELTLNAGVEEASFNFGPIDNAQVDGDHTYTVTAAVWLSSCSCSAAGESAGLVSAPLQVLDDDGPALTLTSTMSTIKEGGKATLTVSRNTLVSLDQPLTVTLSSDYDENLSYDHTVTIPAGQQTVQVEITSKKNDVSGDSHTVVFTVQADGFASGTCWLMVTDQTLPDAVITNISVDKSEVEAGGIATVSVTVKNGGSAGLPSHARIHIYMEGENAILRTLYTQEDLSPGSETTITRQITMNVVPGDRWLYAVVNEEKRFSELSYNNNTSLPKSLRVLSPYKITMDAEKALLKPGQSIVVTGKAIGAHPDSTRLEVYCINEGLRQNFTLVTGADGSFLATIEPYERQTGHFAIGACYPGEGRSEELVGVDILDLHHTTADTITCDVVLGDTYSGSVEIKNPCKATMTAVTAHALYQPEGCRLTFGEIAQMEGGATLKLDFAATGTELTESGKPVEFSVEVSSAEGATTTIPFRFFCRSARARLTSDTDTVNTSMARGAIHEYVIEITNHGKEETGTITLDLPKWMAAYTCTQLPSTGVEETCKVVLRMCPDDDMFLNLPLNGMIGIRCENGEGLAMPYCVVPVAETTGTVEVEVCDIFTFQTAGAPRVEGAMVTLKHAQTETLVSSGVTGADGRFITTVQEGWYLLEVESSRHYHYAAYITVAPEQQVSKKVNLSYKAVTVEWNVIPSEVDDSYEIVSTMNFETNVPVPIVVIDGPSKVDVDAMAIGESLLLQFTLTNKGLINAEQVRFEVPEDGDDWTMRALAYDSPFTLAPYEQVVVPVLLTRIAVTDKSRVASNNRSTSCPLLYPHCMAGLEARYKYLCDEDLIENRAAHIMAMRFCAFAQLFNCIFNGGGAGGGGGNGGGGWGNPGDGGGEGGNGNTICDHDYAERMLFASNWALALLTGIEGIVAGAVMKGLDVAFTYSLDGKVDWLTIAEYMLRPTSKIALSAYESKLELAMKPLPWVYEAINTWIEWGTQLLDLVRLQGASWVVYFDNQVEKMLKQFTNFDSMLLGIFGSPSWYKERDETIIPFWQYIESKGNVKHTYEELAPLKPDCVTDAELKALIDRANSGSAITVRGVRSSSDSNSIVYYANIVKELDEEAQAEGYISLSHRFFKAYNDYMEQLSEVTSRVCASVKIQIQQVLSMNRPAYRGTLEVFNGHDDTAMTDVRLDLQVKDEDGNVATAHEFQINAESLDGFGGEVSLDEAWTLDAQQTGKATVLFIPTKYAAQTGSKKYSFGGTLNFIDPYTGLEKSMSLIPVQLTVNPLPDLELTYLMQRDVYGDDPLTEDVVEPMEEAEFALIINNKGNGEAKNVRMLTEQPKIIENEKGLFIDFDIVSSQVNGEPANLSLGQTIANDFGTIDARSQAYAQWWLRSTLLGHFTSYEVQATHVTSYGNKDLSLVDTVTIHEMIHGFTTASDGHGLTRRGWLVNDIVDADDMPDVVYFTDATQQSLYMATGSIERLSDLEFRLTATAKQAGWNYGSVTDPTGGRQKLVRIVRQSDGAELPVDNVWQTDRTLRDGRDWFYENRLHFVGDMQNGSETYVLTFEERPEVELAVQEFIGVPPEGVIQETPLDAVTVRFNKAIQEETFTADDITLHCQGERQDEKAIGITKQNETDYVLNLSRVNQQDGYYVLTVQTAGITDREGFNGRDGKSASWVQYVNTVEPETYFYVTTTPAGYATFYDSQWAWQLPTELQASVVSSASENKLTYTALDGNVVPKGVPVMLTSNPKQAGTYTLTGTESEAVYSGANLLRGSDMPTMATPEDGERLYILAYGPSGTKWSEVFGWYWGAENGGAFQIEGHKAWLAVPTGVARTRGYAVDGISVETDGQQIPYADMYDLLGRKVSLEPARRLHKGVYIQNRKKVIIK